MRSCLLPVLTALAACAPETPAPPRDEAPPAVQARPASLVSAMPPAGPHTLSFRLSAPSGRPLYLDHCNGAVSWGLEHRVAGVWKPAWIVATDACHSAPIVIPPGRSRLFRETVTLAAGEGLPADTYRIALYGVYLTHDERDHAASTELTHELRVSEPFAFGPLGAGLRTRGDRPGW